MNIKPLQLVRPTRRDWLLTALGAAAALLIVEVGHIIHERQTPFPYKAGGITSPWVPDTVKHWQTPINAMAKRYNVDPNAIAIVMTLESGGYAKADSGEAQGLMQVTPLTAKDIAAKYLKKPVSHYNLLDPATSIEFGTAYLSYLREIFGDAAQGPTWTNTVELVAAGYNGGPGAAQRLLDGKGLTDTQTVIYSRDAFNMWRERFAHDSPTFDRWKERGGTILLNEAKTARQ